MELITLLNQQNKILTNLLDCLKKEKEALIQEDAQALLKIIEEKKRHMNLLEQVEQKREETFPGINLTKLRETGLLTEDLEAAGKELKALVESVKELQETNHLLTRQSLIYVNKMISLIKGSQTPTYNEEGKIGDQKNSFLNESI
jgi:flagellar biosynthesis/type III secretory pathway chaperone